LAFSGSSSTLFEKGLARNSRRNFGADNMYQVIGLVTRCALAREESHGGHYRLDSPGSREEFRKYSRIRGEPR